MDFIFEKTEEKKDMGKEPVKKSKKEVSKNISGEKKNKKNKKIKFKNRKTQKIILNFPYGRNVIFKAGEIKELTFEETETEYFQKRKKYFSKI